MHPETKWGSWIHFGAANRLRFHVPSFLVILSDSLAALYWFLVNFCRASEATRRSLLRQTLLISLKHLFRVFHCDLHPAVLVWNELTSHLLIREVQQLIDTA